MILKDGHKDDNFKFKKSKDDKQTILKKLRYKFKHRQTKEKERAYSEVHPKTIFWTKLSYTPAATMSKNVLPCVWSSSAGTTTASGW